MPHPLSYFKLPVLLLIYFIALSAKAQVYNSSVSAATGGTGRATVEIGDSSFLNPASLVHLKGHYFYASGAKDELVFLIGDNSPESVLPASLGYVQKTSQVNQGRLEFSDINLSLAEFVTDKWALGLNGHLYEYKLPSASYRQANADLGIIFTPESNIGLAIVAYNVFGETGSIPSNFRDKFSLAVGANYIYRSVVRFRADLTSESVLMAGVETYVNRFLITRVGVREDAKRNIQAVTVGLGFSGPRFILSYAYQANPHIAGDYRHSVDLAIPF